MPYASNNNAILFNNCNNLSDLTVRLEVGSDISTVDSSGWTMQLNCYVPPGQYCQTSQVNILQFIVYVWKGILQYEIQYWAAGASLPWPPGYTPQAGTTPWLPCWPNDDTLQTFATGLSGDTLPSGSALGIELGTDSNGGIHQVAFSYAEPGGNRQAGLFEVPVVHPICSFEVNLVGVSVPPHNGVGTFTDSVPNALLRYSVASGELSVQIGGPGSACGEIGQMTDETSNMGYSDIIGAPGSTVTQTLQQLPPTVTPSYLFFPLQDIGTSSSQQTVTVAAGIGITLTSISFVNNPPSDSDQFVCVPPPGEGHMDLQNGVLVITVWYHPTLEGPHYSQLQIAHNAAGSPLIVDLSGVGDAAPAPLLTFSPQSLLFTTKTISNHTVTLTNPGTAPLTIYGIVVDKPSSFTFSTTCDVGPSGGILNPGQSCTITVAYSGDVNSNANLVITHNAVGSPAMIDLEATVGKGPPPQ